MDADVKLARQVLAGQWNGLLATEEKRQAAAQVILARLDDLERRCQQVIGGYMPYRRADEVARWILTGHAEPS